MPADEAFSPDYGLLDCNYCILVASEVIEMIPAAAQPLKLFAALQYLSSFHLLE
ncbi:hypothetical protein VTN96DRAFT_7081 [Rasamsonia emersonii]